MARLGRRTVTRPGLPRLASTMLVACRRQALMVGDGSQRQDETMSYGRAEPPPSGGLVLTRRDRLLQILRELGHERVGLLFDQRLSQLRQAAAELHVGEHQHLGLAGS